MITQTTCSSNMARSTDQDDSSSDDDAELMKRLQSSAVSVEAVLYESQKVAKQGQQRLSRQAVERDSIREFSNTGANDRAASIDSEHDDTHKGCTETLLGPTERKIAAALDQRLDKLISEMFSQPAAEHPNSVAEEGGTKKQKKNKKGSSRKQDTEQGISPEGTLEQNAIDIPAGSNAVPRDTTEAAAQKPMDLGTGIRLFCKAPVNQPVLLLPPGYDDHLYPQDQRPTTAETVRTALTRKRDTAELLLLEHALQVPFPAMDVPTTVQIPVSTAESHEQRVKKAMKRLKKSLEKEGKRFDLDNLAVDGEQIQKDAADYQAKVAASYEWPVIERSETAASSQQHEAELNTTQTEGEQKKKKKKKKKKVKLEAVVVDARQWVPFEARTAMLLGLPTTC